MIDRRTLINPRFRVYLRPDTEILAPPLLAGLEPLQLGESQDNLMRFVRAHRNAMSNEKITGDK